MIRADWNTVGLALCLLFGPTVAVLGAGAVRTLLDRHAAARDERQIAQPLPAHRPGRVRRRRRHRRRLHRDLVLLLVTSAPSEEQGDPADIG